MDSYISVLNLVQPVCDCYIKGMADFLVSNNHKLCAPSKFGKNLNCFFQQFDEWLFMMVCDCDCNCNCMNTLNIMYS